MYEYGCFITLHNLSDEDQHAVRRCFEEANVRMHVDAEVLDFDLETKDGGRWMLRLLADVARIIKEADGEIVCVCHVEDEPVPRYEFLTIREGKLFRDHGRVVRDGNPKEVDPDAA